MGTLLDSATKIISDNNILVKSVTDSLTLRSWNKHLLQHNFSKAHARFETFISLKFQTNFNLLVFNKCLPLWVQVLHYSEESIQPLKRNRNVPWFSHLRNVLLFTIHFKTINIWIFLCHIVNLLTVISWKEFLFLPSIITNPPLFPKKNKKQLIL